MAEASPQNIPVTSILFLDIETTSQQPNYESLAGPWKELWDRKAETLLRGKETETPESIYGRAAIYAEFGKIICISVGVITGNEPQRKLSIKSFFGEDEKSLLVDFAAMLSKWADKNRFLCAHNGKEFDFPYLCRRMVINQVELPAILQIAGKKPWEINFLDTMELWKFGDYKSFVSLNLLAQVLGVPTPKDDIDGSMVGDVYWLEKNLPRIVTYCQKDVVTCAQVYLRMRGIAQIREENIEIKS